MRIRTVKPEFFEDESIGTLSHTARLLAIGTLVLADDEGLLRWTPAYIRASLFMYDQTLKESQVLRAMVELEAINYVLPYAGGKTQARLAWIVTFRNHQRINRPQPGKLPPPSLQNADVVAAYCRRDGWVCGVCGEGINSDPSEWFPKTKPSLDHIVPRSKGGSDYPTNIRLAHFACNASRGNGSVTHSVSEYVKEAVTDSHPEGKGREQGREGKGTIAPRERDALFETVAEVCGIDWHDLTETARGSLNKAVAQIRAVCQDPEEVRSRAANWSYDVPLTPPGLAKHWPSLSQSRATLKPSTVRQLSRAERLEAEGM